MDFIVSAGILLTGGASRRMGRDKASIVVPDLPVTGPVATMAKRTARLLERVAAPALEVGPGHTHLPAIVEDPPGAGPLAAVVAGWDFLSRMGWTGPAVVVATDLPLLTEDVLKWLAGHPAPGSVVPVVDGRVQPLCARYAPADLDTAGRLVRQGARAMKDLVAHIDSRLATRDEWGEAAGSKPVFDDVDTPEDLIRLVPDRDQPEELI